MPLFGEIAAIVTAFLWSMTSIAFTEASKRVGPFYVNVTRMAMALVFLVITLLLFGVRVNLSGNQIFNLGLSGVIGLVIGDTFLFKAYRSIGARMSMLIMSLVPPMSAFLAYFFLKEKLSLIGIVGIFVTMIGIAVVVFKREEKPTSNYRIDYFGILYAVIGAAGQAVGLIYAKFAFNEGAVNGFLAGFVRILNAFIIFYPLAIITNKFKKPIHIFSNDRKALLFTLIGSIFGPFLGITFSMISITYAKVGIASTLMSTMPIIMLPMVRFYYKEELSWISIAGAFVAVAGIAVLFLH